jgi:hypothetical protein
MYEQDISQTKISFFSIFSAYPLTNQPTPIREK